MSILDTARISGLALVVFVAACGPSMDGPPPGPPGATGNVESFCVGGNDLSQVPAAYVTAITKYTTTNTEYAVLVCTEDTDDDGEADFIVIESTNQPEHESVYYDDGHDHYEDYDYDTNKFKYEEVYDDQRLGSAGSNMIEAQTIVMKIPVAPTKAGNPAETGFGTIGLALNGVSFFNENAAPGDEITEELFTFDQCSGHPQMQGVYHYHVDPVCLIRDLGGSVTTETADDGGNTYQWIKDDGTNATLLLGFLLDGFPVYGPVGNGETDCNGDPVDDIDEFNGHRHCTSEFSEPIYHYHVKTAQIGGTGEPVFWITDTHYFGEPGTMLQ